MIAENNLHNLLQQKALCIVDRDLMNETENIIFVQKGNINSDRNKRLVS